MRAPWRLSSASPVTYYSAAVEPKASLSSLPVRSNGLTWESILAQLARSAMAECQRKPSQSRNTRLFNRYRRILNPPDWIRICLSLHCNYLISVSLLLSSSKHINQECLFVHTQPSCLHTVPTLKLWDHLAPGLGTVMMRGDCGIWCCREEETGLCIPYPSNISSIYFHTVQCRGQRQKGWQIEVEKERETWLIGSKRIDLCDRLLDMPSVLIQCWNAAEWSCRK